MNTEQEKYYDAEDIEAPYLGDLLRGELRIYDVPPEYRTDVAYCYAARWARDACPEIDANTEKKLIEYQLLSDIIKARQENSARYPVLHRLHSNYYDPDGLNIYNSVGLI